MRASAGLSFVEAVAALALLSVLLLVALPNLLPGPELDTKVAARELAADMGLARQLATSRKATFVVEFQPPGGPYTGYTLRQDGATDEPGFPKKLPPGVTAAGPEAVPFLPSGAAKLDAPSVDVVLSSGPVTAAVRVTAATGYARVVVP